ncbi:heavy metal-associated isoprenylated plant protein 6-like [Impatiens glandulifera]|uniref:heavy metal-associated isoprenylated plant protein 6-like n=1 Tax=Impatiens glandulifera TaxID=253017 RepID=UPI001FB07B77|nr:heavy metal-associated isoprenylated plant protein 6-like [Impatiens glandulifera]
MGEKDAKTEDVKPKEQKPDQPPPAAAPPAAVAAAAVVLKLDLHCEGCAKKVKRSIFKNFEGAEEVKSDITNHKLTVTGKVDPAKLRQLIEDKTHKKVELISPLPKKDTAGAGEKKPDEKKPEEKKPEAKKPEEKPKDSTVVLKMRLHCEGCMHKIKRVIKKIDGAKSVDFDADKDLLKVTGTMDVKTLVPFLKEKLKRSVEVVPPPKKDEPKKDAAAGGGGEKKVEKEVGEKKVEKEAGGGGDKKDEGEKKKAVEVVSAGETKAVKVEETPKIEVSKMEHQGFSNYPFYSVPAMPVNHGYIEHGYYGMPTNSNHGYPQQHYPNNQTYPIQYPQFNQYPMQYPQPPTMYNTTQMFSDENPNASCSIM